MKSTIKIGDLVRAVSGSAGIAAVPNAGNPYHFKDWNAFIYAHKNKTIGLVCDKRNVDGRNQILVKWFDILNSEPYWYWITNWDGKVIFEVFNES